MLFSSVSPLARQHASHRTKPHKLEPLTVAKWMQKAHTNPLSVQNLCALQVRSTNRWAYEPENNCVCEYGQGLCELGRLDRRHTTDWLVLRLLLLLREEQMVSQPANSRWPCSLPHITYCLFAQTPFETPVAPNCLKSQIFPKTPALPPNPLEFPLKLISGMEKLTPVQFIGVFK